MYHGAVFRPRITSTSIAWLLPLCVLAGVLLYGLNAAYPLLGLDYGNHIGHLLAGKWHFLRQGLFPFRFSPHFCGGMPVYGHYAAMYYSFPQLFALFLDPWVAVQGGILFMMFLGYGGWWYFSRSILIFSSPWAHLTALTISASGFFLLHMGAGHLVYHTVPLMGWFLTLLFLPGEESPRTLALRSCLFALGAGIIIYGAGYITALFTLLTFPLLLSFDLLRHPEHFRMRLKTIFLRICTYGGLSLLLTLSNLVAIWSLMRQFPRTMPFDRFAEGVSTLGFMLRSLFMIPQWSGLYTDLGMPVGIHEFSMLLSPIVPIGLASLFVLAFRKRVFLFCKRKQALIGILLAGMFLLFFVELTRGYGVLATPLQKLPILSSIHVVVRFLYPFSLAIAIAGILGLRALIREFPLLQHYERTLLLAASFLTVFTLPLAYASVLSPTNDHLHRVVRYDKIKGLMEDSRWLKKSVASARWGGTFPFHVLQSSTGVRCPESLFGYQGEEQITTLVQGPVHMVSEEAFNLNNPACLQYPEENGCHPGDRIAVGDRENFERFRSGERTTWKLSLLQHVSDWVSLAALIGIVVGLFLYGERPREYLGYSSQDNHE